MRQCGHRRIPLFLFCVSRKQKKKRKRILPGSSGKGRAAKTIPLSFVCPKVRGKENDTREGKISGFSPSLDPPSFKRPNGACEPLLEFPEDAAFHPRGAALWLQLFRVRWDGEPSPVPRIYPEPKENARLTCDIFFRSSSTGPGSSFLLFEASPQIAQAFEEEALSEQRHCIENRQCFLDPAVSFSEIDASHRTSDNAPKKTASRYYHLPRWLGQSQHR